MCKKHLRTIVLAVLLGGAAQSSAKEFTQNGAAMEPTIEDRQVVESSVFFALFYEPSRWDIVLYRNPNGEFNALLGRIVGMPNEVMEITEEGLVVNGERLELPAELVKNGIKYLPASKAMPGSKDRAYTIGKGEYFILGDNSANSLDSRFFGVVPRSSIMNKIEIDEAHNK